MPNDPEFPKEKSCDCCGFGPDVELENYPRRGSMAQDGSSKELCCLCAATHAGSAIDFPQQYAPNVIDTLKTICYVGNVILAEIRKGKADNESG